MKKQMEVILLLDSQGQVVGRRYAMDEPELKELKDSVFGFFKVTRGTLTYEDGLTNGQS